MDHSRKDTNFHHGGKFMSSGRGEVEFISIIVKCTRTFEVQEKLTSNFPHGGSCGYFAGADYDTE
jgi:hypothetical protein